VVEHRQTQRGQLFGQAGIEAQGLAERVDAQAPGNRARNRANKSSVFWRVVARFMRLSTGSGMCCSGMSM